MDPNLPEKNTKIIRRKVKVRRKVVQRLPFGSPATNTLNLPPPPPPCYVHHLLIHEEWSKDNTKPPEVKTPKRDPLVIAKEIEKTEKDLENAGYKLDNAVLDDAVDYDTVSPQIKKDILDFQTKLIKLDMERIAAQAELGPYSPPKGIREFVVVEYVPPTVTDVITQAEGKLKPLRIKLNNALDEWFKAHTDHENVKQQLTDFAKKKKKLAAARDKARVEYETARRNQSDAVEKYDPTIKKGFKQWRQRKKMKQADKTKTADKAKLIEAQNAYFDFTVIEYNRVKREEKDLYTTLIAKLKEVNDITTQMGVIEAEAQAAKNTLASPAKIQMTSFEEGWDFTSRKFWTKKVPVVELQLDGKTTLFPADQKFCRDNPPQFNETHWDPTAKKRVNHRHPHLHITEPESKLDQTNKPANPSTKFRIFEIHRKIFTPTKTGVGAAFNKLLSGVVAVFQHIFSAFPKKRYYKILAETCGFMPSGMPVPAKLEATLEVFPADVYTITLKTQPGFGYENIVREEKISDTRKIAGEVAGSDAENAASPWDKTVSSSESTSVLGVTQSSTTTSTTTSAAYRTDDGEIVSGRELTTVTTLGRDGVFGTSTVTDITTGTLNDKSYSSTMERTQTLGSPLTDDEKLKSLKQTYTDEDGVVTDASKTVDSQGVATAIEDDGSGEDSGTTGTRVPSLPANYLPQIPIDLILSRNGVEDPITEDLRKTLGLIIFLVRRCGDFASRIGNVMPSVGWKFGFSMTFLTGTLSYTHDYQEHTDYRVWLHHKFDLDINLITAKVFVFGGVSYEFFLLTIQAGIEVYIQGMIGVKGNFEKTHPDADKGWEIGFGPNGSIGIGAEAKIILGQPDWFQASGSIETSISVDAMWWLKKEGENSPFLEYEFKWEGVKLKGVLHIALVGHWEKEIPICDERMIKAGRFPQAQKDEQIKQMLEDQNKELEASYKQRQKEAIAREKKLKKKGKLAKIKK